MIKKSFFIRILKFLGAAFLILCAAVLFILQEGFRIDMPACDQGPLEKIQACKKDHSYYTWQGSGWWFSQAEGTLTPELCTKILAKAPQLSINADTRTLVTVNVLNCEILGLNNKAICYASQKLASNGNSRYVTVLATDAYCKDALYFTGSKASIKNGEPLRIDHWQEPYEGIVEPLRTATD